jgi:hypothetical protein
MIEKSKFIGVFRYGMVHGFVGNDGPDAGGIVPTVGSVGVGDGPNRSRTARTAIIEGSACDAHASTVIGSACRRDSTTCSHRQRPIEPPRVPVWGTIVVMAELRRVRPVGRAEYRWADYEDDALLNLRFSSLRLRLRDSLVWPDVERLCVELERREFRFKPHVWLSEEWFSPDGIPGIAIPFFVAHPRLRQLERTMMGDVEGGSSKWRLRILRHEAGHAIDTAYGLRRRADWRGVFGRASAPYPNDYSPRPSSRRHVLHLGHWYAQSHPTEDFAETFAVWLQPKARWRRDYEDWPALAKLEYVDELMEQLRGQPPRRRDRSVIEPLAGNDRTLREHYRRKRARYIQAVGRYDQWMTRTFTTRMRRPQAVAAGRFVRDIAPQLRRLLVRRARLHPYMVDHAIGTVAQRARQLDLVLRGTRAEARTAVVRLHERIVLDVLKRNRENYVL